MAKSFVLAIPVTSFDTAGANAAYQAINPNGLTHNCFMIRVINTSNITIELSYDGVTDNDILQPDATLQLNLQSNSSPNGYITQMRKGTVVSVKSTSGAAGVGLVYLVGYYQEI